MPPLQGSAVYDLIQGWRASRLPLASFSHAFSMMKIKCDESL
jgi:hypothetical protein